MNRELLLSLNIFVCKCFLSLRRELYKWGMPKATATEKIIISMTSWAKRIDNVPAVIESILKNTIRPNKIVLNLSLEEFPTKEKDLPEKLVSLQEKGVIEIGWQEGNAKAFKKIIPTLKRYPHDAIIAIDDDFIYPKDFVETFIKMHHKFPHNLLSGNCTEIKGVKLHCGCASLVKAEYFGDYIDKLLTPETISLSMDDIFYTYCAEMNRCHYIYVGKEFFMNMEKNNPTNGISDTDPESMNMAMAQHMEHEIRKKYHIDISTIHQPHFVY